MDANLHVAAPAPTSGPPLQPLHLIDEISHRVVNEYAEAIRALGLAAAASLDTRAQIALTSAAVRLRAQAEGHRALQAPVVDGPMNLAEYIGQLCGRLAKALFAERCFRLTVDADETWLDAEHCWRVGLIVAELVRRAARHASAGAVWVEITESSGRLKCQVFDDGRGALFGRTDHDNGPVRSLARELGGSIDWLFAPGGCCVRLEFPGPRAALADRRPPRRARVSHFPNPAPGRRFR
jgi:two-component sensor histidine kinase